MNDSTFPKILHSLSELEQWIQLHPIALAIGVFDGVHLGHRKVLDALLQEAQRQQAIPIALTFDPHPRNILNNNSQGVELLFSLEDRIELLKQSGMQGCVVMPFDREFAALEPNTFLDMLFASRNPVKAIAVGSHWRFGRGGMGNTQLLQQYAMRQQWRLLSVPEAEYQNKPVSSSRIRSALKQHLFDAAEQMLGREYFCRGTVRHGYAVAGTKLDCPTANLELSSGILPEANGVYAGWVALNANAVDACNLPLRAPALFNLGVSPTYANVRNATKQPQRRIEAHLWNFYGSLYDCEVQFSLRHFFRPEQKFDSEAQLKQQIAMDLSAFQAYLNAQELENSSATFTIFNPD